MMSLSTNAFHGLNAVGATISSPKYNRKKRALTDYWQRTRARRLGTVMPSLNDSTLSEKIRWSSNCNTKTC